MQNATCFFTVRRHLALIAFIFGFAAVGLAAFQNNFVYKETPPPPQKTLKEETTEALKKWWSKKVRESAHASTYDPRHLPLHPYQMVYTALGVVAMGLGIFAWTQKNHVRLSGGAVALGVMAVAWQWVLVGVLVAVVILIIANWGI